MRSVSMGVLTMQKGFVTHVVRDVCLEVMSEARR